MARFFHVSESFAIKYPKRISDQTDDHRTGQGKLERIPVKVCMIDRVQDFSVIFQGQVPLHGGVLLPGWAKLRATI